MGTQKTALQRRATAFLKRARKQEGGFSLAEILIVVAVIGVIGALVAATLIQTSQTSTRYSEATMTQAELLDSISHVTRQISLARNITLAGDDYLQLEGQEGGKKVVTTIFYHTPGVAPDSRFGLTAGVELPDFPAVVEHRLTEDGGEIVRILVTNYSPSPTQPLFSYFDRQNKEMSTPVDTIELGSIERIAVWLTSTVEGRSDDQETIAMELATSATPRLAMQSGTSVSELAPPATPILRGTLAPRTQTANLTWSNVAGATSYILFRDNPSQNPTRASINLAAGGFSSTEPSYDDPNRSWGETYRYSVVAVGPGGLSGESNQVALTVVPQQPQFTNVDPNNHANNATSARGLSNRLNWTARNGAEGYRLYRGSTLIYTGTATAYTDSGRSYGANTRYTVVAFNSGQNGSGGDSFTSTHVDLISPPVAPSLSTGHTNGTRNLSWNQPQYAQEYELNRTTPSATTWNTGASRSYNDAQAIDSASFTYRVRAGNAAGMGPWSASASIAARPGTPALSGQDYRSHPSTRDGQNYVSWSSVSNAQDYEWRRGSGSISTTSSRSFTDTSPGWGSRNSYSVRACNITGCSGWSTVTLDQPPGPFSVSGMSQVKRSGQRPMIAGSQDDFPLVTQSASISWGGASGASSYTVLSSGGSAIGGNHGSTVRSASVGGITPGSAYRYRIRANASNGLSRETSFYHFQAAPAQVHSVGTRPQTTNGRNSRTTFWANTSPVVGSSTRAEQATYVIHGTSLSSYSGFHTWTGGEVASAEWDKALAGPGAWIGGLQLQRTMINIPSGYTVGSVSQQNINIKGTGANGTTTGNYSWTTSVAFRASGPVNWGGSYNGSWRNVSYSSGNYPSAGGYDYELIYGR